MNALTSKSAALTDGFQNVLHLTFSAVEKMVASVQKQLNYNRTVSALSALDTHELADIGLVRADIKTVAITSNN